MIKLHKPKVCVKTKDVVSPAHIRVYIDGELSAQSALKLGQRLIDLGNKAYILNKKVTK